MRAQLRGMSRVDGAGRELASRVDALESQLRAPQGGRRHGGKRHV
jgi:hypothetical protein